MRPRSLRHRCHKIDLNWDPATSDTRTPTLLQDPAFAEAYEDLVATVEALREKHPDAYRKKAPTKILAAIEKLTKSIIPADRASSAFDMGNAIGPEHRAWKRATFLQQFRLIFRYGKRPPITPHAAG